MTPGHKHRVIRTTPTSRLTRVLTGVTLHRSEDRVKVERSRFAYLDCPEHGYRLSLLGLLHGLTGLTLDVQDRRQSGPIRRLLCSHHSVETVTTPESGEGWTGWRRETRCLDCGKTLPPPREREDT